MRYPSRPVEARLVDRPNRFLGVVEVDGALEECFIPNPGRMHELMVPGARVYLLEKRGEHRKTRYDMVLVDYGGVMVSVDSRLPNTLLAEAVNAGRLNEFRGYTVEKTEPVFHDSRLDLVLSDGRGQVMVETKSCTLVEDGVALFPDAPTERGARHMRTLVKALETGRSAAVFVIQRGDASEFRPNDGTDPEFGEALRRAASMGVETYAYVSDVSLRGVEIREKIPLRL
ncbi:MAG TPA: DNA/RNA nuclease SfsA [Candidatus Krumholzibacteriaceae bacterium]|nr:DNA/RNA nuclease SfsA [Candidatus Krumholzibacteriaceae bacterium]